jgi:hypothetical protein
LVSQVERVVIAVIDQGFAFANSRFFNGNQSRIEYLWEQNMQTAMPSPGLTMPFTPGFELDKTAIINAMANARAIGADEEWIYRVYGGLNFTGDSYKPLARRRTHGTHVLDLAAEGTDPTKHPIILVDMPEDAVGDPAGSTLSVQAAWGLIYILDRTEKLRNASVSEVLPVVVNLSYGPHEGPHDGTGVLEVFMDKIWQLADGSYTPLEIVLAAGNARQTRTHAAFNLRARVRKNLRWRLQPGSLSASLMEIWLPPGGGHSVTVTLTPPFISGALQPISVSPTNPGPVPGGGGLYLAEYVSATSPATADSIVLSIARTAPDPAGGWGSAVVPSGLWSVTLSSVGPMQGVNGWIKRSDTLSGRRAKGRQSYFDDRSGLRFGPNGRPLDYDPASSSYVKRLGTLSGIATGRRTRIIGGYRSSDIYPARYSSHGTRTTAVAAMQGPDWLECCEESDVLRGVLGSGTHSGSTVRMNGTSVAAPQGTRFLAQEWLATGTRPTLPPGLFVPLPLAQRPIPVMERPPALSNGLAPSRLSQPPVR